jgi:uncharacterized protein YukE
MTEMSHNETPFYVNRYDNTILYVDPDGLKRQADSLLSLVQSVNGSLSTIQGVLEGLQFNWAGQTAAEVADFNGWWSSVMRQLFGTEDDPEAGVLQVIASGLMGVAGNFAEVEQELAKNFRAFGAGLESGGDGTAETPTTAPEDVDDLTYTAITEVW